MARAKKQPTTLADIDAEIARLQKERDAIHASEVKVVIGRIKEAIAYYGLSAEDLGLAPKRRERKPTAVAVDATTVKKRVTKRAALKKPPSALKYTNGEGKTWTGHGKRPGWFVEALAAGKTPEDLLFKSEG